MTNDELRALADALHWVQYTADWQACDQAADYLRAQADAQPVAWRYTEPDSGAWFYSDIPVFPYVCDPLYTHPAPSEPAVPDGWKLVPVEPTHEILHAEIGGADWNGKTGDERARAVWAAVLAAAPAVPQAEPKREPLTYEQLVSACYTYRHDFGLLDPDEQELVIEEAGRWAKAFGIGGSDEHQ